MPPTSVCAWLITSGPRTVAVEVNRRRDDRDRAGDPRERDRRDDGGDERADASELAAALRVLEPEAREERVAADLRRRPAEREEPERADQVTGMRIESTISPSSIGPSGSASQPGWYSSTRS